MSFQVDILSETYSTVLTGEWFFLEMCTHVIEEPLHIRNHRAALNTSVGVMHVLALKHLAEGLVLLDSQVHQVILALGLIYLVSKQFWDEVTTVDD